MSHLHGRRASSRWSTPYWSAGSSSSWLLGLAWVLVLVLGLLFLFVLLLLRDAAAAALNSERLGCTRPPLQAPRTPWHAHVFLGFSWRSFTYWRPPRDAVLRTANCELQSNATRRTRQAQEKHKSKREAVLLGVMDTSSPKRTPRQPRIILLIITVFGFPRSVSPQSGIPSLLFFFPSFLCISGSSCSHQLPSSSVSPTWSSPSGLRATLFSASFLYRFRRSAIDQFIECLPIRFPESQARIYHPTVRPSDRPIGEVKLRRASSLSHLRRLFFSILPQARVGYA